MTTTIVEHWKRLVAVHVDLAIRERRSEAIDGEVAAMLGDAVRAQSEATAAAELPISSMARRLGLTLTEELVAWTLVVSQVAPELGPAIEALSGGPEPTVGALAAIAYRGAQGKAVAELSPGGRLARFGLVERNDDVRMPQASWARRTVRASERLLGLALATEHEPWADQPRYMRPLDEAPPVASLAVAEASLGEVRAALDVARAVVIVSGLPGLGRRTVLSAAARECGMRLLEVDARRLATEPVELAGQARTIAREARLQERVPLLVAIDALVDDKGERLDIVASELAAALDGAVLATCGPRVPKLAIDRPTLVITFAPPAFDQRAELWIRSLGQGSRNDAELLADRYPLAPALVARAARTAVARAGARDLCPEDIYAGIRATLDDRLGQFATRVAPTQSWEDLVLPNDQLARLFDLAARVREHRTVYERWGFAAKVGKGLGLSALFSGPPGTGKTMVAALLARELGLELYQVDLGKVVSKFIGETEKNLAALFDAAEAGRAILLFDEADSLFGKRTDVRSSNDRYANLETNYLLQRLESFTGICLLTSNHERNIDPAFLRRLSMHLRFDMPDVSERARLWKAMLPADAPVEADLDVSSLAQRYQMSGGYIRNATLRAAFRAADQRVAISRRLLEDAARLEYEDMGKIAA
jgi:AAA+ superfamily predicted ATPase